MQTRNRVTIECRFVMGSLLFLLSMLSPAPAHVASISIDIPGPPNSGQFGTP